MLNKKEISCNYAVWARTMCRTLTSQPLAKVFFTSRFLMKGFVQGLDKNSIVCRLSRGQGGGNGSQQLHSGASYNMLLRNK